jgi:predicted permease
LVSGDWFSLLGVPVPVGRALSLADDRTLGGSPVAVLSDGYWARRFGRDPSVVGRAIRLNETTVTVVGVAPSGFSGMVVGTPVDVWLPIMMQHAAHYAVDFSSHNADGSKPWPPQEGIEWLTVVARVPTGAAAAVGARVDASYRRSLEAQAALIENPDRRAQALRQHVAFLAGARGVSPLRDDMSGAVLVLMATVALLLLVACANLANLLAARSAARAQEFAVRRSLGAGRGRLIRQFLTESLTLALIGGVGGLFAARWSGRALLRLASATSNPIPLALPLDWHVFAAALGVSLATGLFFGLAPAWHLSGSGAQNALTSAKRVLGGPARSGVIPLAKTLVVVQVAVSLVLLVGAGVFVRTFRNLLSVDSGFERAHVVSARFDPRLAGFTKAQLPALFDRLLDYARAIPGVKSASVALSGPVTGSERISGVAVPGEGSVREEYVGPDYFTTIGTPLLRGRDFDLRDDAHAQPVAIVNEAMVKHFFSGENPIGRQFGYGTDHLFEIVGVARDAKIDGPRDQTPEMAYYPAAQHPDEYLGNLYVRVAGPTDQASGALRRALVEAEPKLAVREVVTLEELNARMISRERLVSNLTGVFGLLAVAVGCLGLYGTVSYSVARRTNEIGIRLALGASCGNVRWLVLRETLLLVVVGSVVGLALVWPGLAAVSSLVYGLSARDPLTIGTAALLLAVVSIVAGAIPAWRASRLDPTTALRLE